MKTRISAMICLLCVLGYPLSASADSADDELPTISSGTIEPYLSFMAGVSLPFDADATFQNGDVERNVDYQMKQSIGGNAGIWFPTRNKLAGFDLGGEIEGFVWFPDVACCRVGVNASINPADGSFEGTTTEMQGIYIGANLMLRVPMAVSEAYPNGRWFPYVGVGGERINSRLGRVASGGMMVRTPSPTTGIRLPRFWRREESRSICSSTWLRLPRRNIPKPFTAGWGRIGSGSPKSARRLYT